MLNPDDIRKLNEMGIFVIEGTQLSVGAVISAAMSEMPIIALNINSVMPTAEELAELIAYRTQVAIRNGHRPEEAPKASTVDGFNTVVFIKGDWWRPNGAEGWAYRRLTWSVGPMYFPGSDAISPPPYTLKMVIDHISRPVALPVHKCDS